MVWAAMPPPQYVHPPHVAVHEMHLSVGELQRLCHGSDRVVGCSFVGKWQGAAKGYSTCFVVLPTGTRLDLKKLRRHELAHCNGWPADHPDGHQEYVGELR